VPGGYSRTPKLIKGVLVELSQPFLGPIPNAIAFQYNPEQIKRELIPWHPPGEDPKTSGEDTDEAPATAQPFDPQETFTLALELDATDELEFPELHPAAALTGVADRIAALEMLLYPIDDSLLGDAFASLDGAADAVPRGTVPVVLFIWGPGRALPVRLTSFTVDEEAFSPTLYPLRATVSVGLRVLTPGALTAPDTEPSESEKMAIAAYEYTRKQKEVLARANLANTAESILGVLPL
jgi:hypothetical protein